LHPNNRLSLIGSKSEKFLGRVPKKMASILANIYTAPVNSGAFYFTKNIAEGRRKIILSIFIYFICIFYF
jgi:hypothetical protein